MTPVDAWPATLPPFLWGTSTSAHQVDGEDATSDWAAAEPSGRVPTAGMAADHWRLFREDIARFRAQNLNAYRFSTEWSRIEPVPDRWDREAVSHYREMVQACREAGLEPFVTLHHFTLPAWLQDRGGWLHPQAPALFARYVAHMAAHLGDVKLWCTINEPTMLAVMGYVRGVWPPFRRNPVAALRLIGALQRAHRAAWAAIKKAHPPALVGLAHSMLAMRPASSMWADRAAADLTHRLYNLKTVDLLADVQDFIGLNYYTRAWIRWHHLADPLMSRGEGPVTDMGWEIDPEGFAELLAILGRRYRRPILITENGIATEDDLLRARYVAAHLAVVKASRQAPRAVPVHGYFYWSGIDNYEWIEGYRPRFGLYRVDYASQQRTLKAGAEILAQWAGQGPP